MREARIGDAVAVDWIDAWCDNEETRASDWKDEMRATTYGVLARDGTVVTVISETFEEGIGRSTTHIPRGIVLGIRRLKEAAE